MKRGTTPTHTFTTDIDLSDAVEIYVTYKQGNTIVREYTLADGLTVTEDTITLTLSQADTLAANPNHKIAIQIRAKLADGTTAVASNVIMTTVEQILKDGEI